MATTTNSRRTTSRSSGSSTAARRRQAATTQRSTAGKKAAATRRRNAARRSAASKRAARTRELSARTPVEQFQETAERVVNVPVGAVLVARDRVTETVSTLVDRYGSRTSAQRNLESNIKKFERRGARARRDLERDAKRTRTRVERVVRQNRTRLRREVKSTRRDVGARVDLVSAQVENAVQTGLTAGQKVVSRGQETVGIA